MHVSPFGFFFGGAWELGLRISPEISPCLGLGVEGLRNIYFERLCDLILHALTVASNLRHDYLKQSPCCVCVCVRGPQNTKTPAPAPPRAPTYLPKKGDGLL